MDRQTMSNSHEVQIKALLEGDYDTFKAEFSGTNFDPVYKEFKHNHHSAWGYTGAHPHSLFGCLPDSDKCLTQIKRYGLKDHDDWDDILDLENNDLIPSHVEEDTMFTEAQLREFSRLQLQANFSEEVT